MNFGEASLPHDTIQVWRYPLASDFRETHWQLLSIDEQQRALRFSLDIHKNRFVNARAGLRLLLAKYVNERPEELRFTYSEYGKPSLRAYSELIFSVSHSAELCVFSVARGIQHGIDIEEMTGDCDLREIETILASTSERASIHRLGRVLARRVLYNKWAHNEAYLKAIGTGLIGYPREPVFSEVVSGWCFLSFVPVAGYVGALCIKHNRPNISFSLLA